MINEIGNETNLNSIVNRFSKQVTTTAITIFIYGMIVSTLTATLNFTAGFMIFSSTTGFFGGLLISEVLFYRLTEVKI